MFTLVFQTVTQDEIESTVQRVENKETAFDIFAESVNNIRNVPVFDYETMIGGFGEFEVDYDNLAEEINSLLTFGDIQYQQFSRDNEYISIFLSEIAEVMV